MTRTRSLLKYPGGKYALLDAIEAELPKCSIDVYAEPFLGGASVALNIGKRFSEMLLNDANVDVINFWEQIATNPESVLKAFEQLLQSNELLKSEDVYLECRKSFNEKRNEPSVRAAELYYLNKQGFNGLIRYNLKGEFNVPFGKYKNLPNLKSEHLEEVSQNLRGNVSFYSIDWENFIDGAVSKAIHSGKSVFLYIDPPYIPLTRTSNFTCYWKPFGLQKHQQLRYKLDKLTESGVFWMLSNSKTKATEDIFDGYNFIEVIATRNISCKGSGRGVVAEYIITNY